MPESILYITPVGGDDQREYSDVSHCAIHITCAGFAALKSRLAAYDTSREPMDAYKALLYVPDGVTVSFLNDLALAGLFEPAEDDEPEIVERRKLVKCPELDSTSTAIFADVEADRLNEFCEDASAGLEWSIDLTLISVVAVPDFYATAIYDAGGMVNSRRLNLAEIEKHFPNS